MIIPEKKLKDGRTIPVLGYSTRNITKKNALSALKTAVDSGCRHIVTESSQQIKDIGTTVKRVLSTCSLKRQELFITHTIIPGQTKPKEVASTIRQTIVELQSDYLDLCILQDPEYNEEATENDSSQAARHDVVCLWKEIENLYQEGLVRAIGISNFSISSVQQVLDECTVEPIVHLISAEALNDDLIEFCVNMKIDLAVYLSRGNKSPDSSRPDDLSYWNKIAMKYGKTPDQTVVRAYIERGFIAVVESQKLAEIRKRFQVFDFEIEEADVTRMMVLEETRRHNTVSGFGSDRPVNIVK